MTDTASLLALCERPAEALQWADVARLQKALKKSLDATPALDDVTAIRAWLYEKGFHIGSDKATYPLTIAALATLLASRRTPAPKSLTDERLVEISVELEKYKASLKPHPDTTPETRPFFLPREDYLPGKWQGYCIELFGRLIAEVKQEEAASPGPTMPTQRDVFHTIERGIIARKLLTTIADEVLALFQEAPAVIVQGLKQ